ncbi:MAG: response regulator [Pyrinomonadaceae bacterium]
MLQILHLEDNLLDAELVAANLLEGGLEFEVERVDTHADFVAAVERDIFNLILADYSLPSFDGLAALEIARNACPDKPFIIISGALGEELAIETLKSGATDYILKHRLERLMPSVRRALRESAEREARQQAERDRELLLVSEQEARLKAEEAVRLKDEFLATISHELRTPLNAIYGWASMLRGGRLNSEDAANAVKIIERNAKIQIQLIEDLLDVSRMITGNLRLEIEAVEPTFIIQAAIDAVRPAAEAKLIKITTDFDSKVHMILADASRLQQIAWNLLSNAVKFTPPEGRVEVSLRTVDNHVEICVRDSGAGVSLEFLPHVFERFRQAEQATTRVHGGLVLGLAIVKNLVEMHGGSITAESKCLGTGSTFTVFLPQIAFSENGAEKKSFGEIITAKTPVIFEDDVPLAGLHVLAVDDDADSRELLQMFLSQNGATVDLAANSEEAMEKFRDTSPDILISDVGMPGEDGYSLISKIRDASKSYDKQIPAIALTGFARAEDRQRAIQAGFDNHISKPIEPKILVQAIVDIIKSLRN